VLVEHAYKLTLDPAGVHRDGVQALRDAGFSDRAILDLTLVIAYFNFVNRLADGLGVPLEVSP
jgi:alkylhydroperoxidase family enzyme